MNALPHHPKEFSEEVFSRLRSSGIAFAIDGSNIIVSKEDLPKLQKIMLESFNSLPRDVINCHFGSLMGFLRR